MLTSNKEFILGASPKQIRKYAKHNDLTTTEYKHVEYADQVIGYKELKITLLEGYEQNKNIEYILFALTTTRASVLLIFKEGESPYNELKRATVSCIFAGESNPNSPLDILSKFIQC